MGNIPQILRMGGLCMTLALLATKVEAQANAAADRKLFDAVSGRLDPGGRLFAYMNVRDNLRGAIAEVKAFYDDLVATDDEGKIPRDFDLERLLLDLGIHEIDALGYSALAQETGYRNKLFIAADGPKHGLLRLLCEPPQPFKVATFAPEAADAAFEFEVPLAGLKSLIETVGARLEPVTEMDLQAGFLNQPVPNAPFTWETLLTKASGRISGFVVTHDYQLELSLDKEMEVPATDVVITHWNGEWIFQQLSIGLGVAGDDRVKKTEGDGFTQFELLLPVEVSLGFYKPVIYFDESSGALHISTRARILKQALEPGRKLSDKAAYRLSMKDLPDKGTSMTFVSQELYSEFAKLFREIILASSEIEKAPEAFADWIVDWIGPDASQATASVITNSPEGIEFVSLSPQPVSTLVTLAGANAVVIGAMAAPVLRGVFGGVKKAAEQDRPFDF